MKKTILIIAVVLAFASCNNTSQLQNDLNDKLEALDYQSQFDKILAQCPDDDTKDAISFLYAYMPLGDIADYEPQLYLDGVKYAFMAKKEMTWGPTIPEDIFRHFVLPLRVNNENLDSARTVFYKELKDRVSGLSMYDAVLEVNHWCHEKVAYTPSDARTSSPLASVRTAYGRCGEESTFTVSALRSVGIPARQVYTPRWAHTDDNHAWVEAWVDGTWYYLGACEPEAKLNVAWFSSTALRALLMHNRVFGYYVGNEDVIQRTKCFTEINVTSNYTPVERLVVKIKDTDGKVVDGAKVEFKIYNYAELYSAITGFSDKKGEASAIFGKGDVVVWASKGDKFGYVKANSGEDSEYDIVLNRTIGDAFSEDLDIIPPMEGKVEVELSQDEIDTNNARLHYEDSLRNRYVSTFIKPSNGTREEKALAASRGNWREIMDYMTNISMSALKSDEASRERYFNGLELLNLVSEKDLRDTPSWLLLSHLDNYDGAPDEKLSDLYLKYVLNPRIANELLSPWRSDLMHDEQIAELGGSVDAIIDFVGHIKVLNQYNPQNIPITPCGVMKLRAADSNSRDIFFVAMCRAWNIPARIEEISGKVQYWGIEKGEWIDVSFGHGHEVEDNPIGNTPKGWLKINYAGNSFLADPKFETHFTVAKISDGSINTLNFRDKEGIEGTMSWKNTFDKDVELDCGYYMLTSGTRMASGKVLCRVAFFNIVSGQTTDVELIMREDKNDLQVIGNTNAEPLLPLTGRGMFVVGFMKANHEPSNHIIRDIFREQWDMPVVLMYSSDKEFDKFVNDAFPQAPDKVMVIVDKDNLFRQICSDMKIDNPEMPLVVLADSFGRIFYVSQGYKVGITEQLRR